MMLNILIVDDEPDVLKLEKDILESANYKVETSTNAEEALVKLIQKDFDLIISDVNMPGINGYELCKFLTERCSKSSKKQPPVIMVSGKSEPEDMTQGFEAGAITYLLKPFTASSLITAVKMVLPDSE